MEEGREGLRFSKEGIIIVARDFIDKFQLSSHKRPSASATFW